MERKRLQVLLTAMTLIFVFSARVAYADRTWDFYGTYSQTVESTDEVYCPSSHDENTFERFNLDSYDSWFLSFSEGGVYLSGVTYSLTSEAGASYSKDKGTGNTVRSYGNSEASITTRGFHEGWYNVSFDYSVFVEDNSNARAVVGALLGVGSDNVGMFTYRGGPGDNNGVMHHFSQDFPFTRDDTWIQVYASAEASPPGEENSIMAYGQICNFRVDFIPDAQVPIPGAVWLLGTGLLGLIGLRRNVRG